MLQNNYEIAKTWKRALDEGVAQVDDERKAKAIALGAAVGFSIGAIGGIVLAKVGG
jgi:hypothetical protein